MRSIFYRILTKFVIWHSDLYSASVSAVLYEILCYIGPRYSGIRLYNSPSHDFILGKDDKEGHIFM